MANCLRDNCPGESPVRQEMLIASMPAPLYTEDKGFGTSRWRTTGGDRCPAAVFLYLTLIAAPAFALATWPARKSPSRRGPPD